MVINTQQYQNLHENGVHAQFPAEKKTFDLHQENNRRYYYRLCRSGSRGRVQGVRTPPAPLDDLRFSNTTGILQKKKKTMWFIGVEVEQETSAPPPKKNPGSAPVMESK